MIPIRASAQTYHWGKVGYESLVGKYVARTFRNDLPDNFQDTHYAELWMGTHSKSPSSVKIEESLKPILSDEFYTQNLSSTVDLNEILSCHKDKLLNAKLLDMDIVPGSGTLPFLFKILSVNTSLSIQAHPHKELASELHSEFPDIYKDANHKPEMIIALTKFEALWGFSDQIYTHLTEIKALNEFYSQIDLERLNHPDTVKEALKEVMQFTFEVDQEKVTKWVTQLFEEISKSQIDENNIFRKDLVLRLQQQYPNDVGIIVSYLLNYIILNPGEALVLEPNEPHAYLQGEGIEWMATSDNVVRGGLTPKFKDAKTLVDMLTYNTGKANIINGDPTHVTNQGTVADYKSGFPEFSVKRITLDGANDENMDLVIEDPSILLCLEGQGDITDQEYNIENHVKQFDTFYMQPGVTYR